MNKELKPCPFCGGEAKQDVFVYKNADDSYDYEAVIFCKSCVAVMHGASQYDYDDFSDDAINDLIEAWNRRVDT